MSQAFFELHSGLPREAPGDFESLKWALQLAGTPERSRILDAGCGPGADLHHFDRLLPRAALVGIDQHGPFIETLRLKLPHVQAIQGDMLQVEGQFDLIWSAGSAYGPGVLAALAAWRPHLTHDGAIAFSDCLWRKSKPAQAARDFWDRDYPQMCDLPNHLSRLEKAGWQIKGARWLGKTAWESYYAPMSDRIALLRPTANAAMQGVLDEAQAEIDLWRAHGDDYGYYLTVVVPA